MAELEQASLRSEQLSDKSSSPALPDDLSLDEQSVYQMAAKEGKVRRAKSLSERRFCHNASPPFISVATLTNVKYSNLFKKGCTIISILTNILKPLIIFTLWPITDNG